MIIRADIKQAAKEQLRGNVGTYFLSYLIMGVVIGLIYGLMALSGFIRLGDAQFLMVILYAITFVAGIIVVPAFLIGIIRLGLNLYYGRRAEISDVFDGFRFPGKIIWLNIITSFFKFCWTLIPIAGFVLGIIKKYSYAMAPYVLADNPNLTAREALSQSKKIMHGHKMDLFIMELSFIGWYILVALTFGIVGIYVTPYKSLSYVNFYKAASGERRPAHDYSSKRHCIHCGRELYGDEVCSCMTETIDSTEPTRFCIHCGKVLHGSEECTCRIPEPIIKRDSDVESSRFCIYCGKILHGSEECSCREAEKPSHIIEEKESSRFCIHCGKTLVGDEKCSCEITKTPGTGSALKDTMRTRTEEKRFCTKCGKTLIGDEICSCESKKAIDPGEVKKEKEDTPVSSIPPVTMVSGGLKSTMRGTDKPVDYKELSDKEEGKKFLNKAGDLD